MRSDATSYGGFLEAGRRRQLRLLLKRMKEPWLENASTTSELCKYFNKLCQMS